MTITKAMTESELIQKLTELTRVGERCTFVPNTGNAGDGLICAATWRLLDLGNITVKSAAKPDDTRSVLILGGGGNLIPGYEALRSTLVNAMTIPFERIIILPHTIRGNEDLLGRMDQRFHIFCRDLKTLEHVGRYAPHAYIYLADDIALSLDTAWMLNTMRYWINLIALVSHPRILKKYLKWRLRISAIQPKNDSLNLLRVDVEARDSTPRDASQDLSACYGSHFTLRAEAELIGHDFLRVLQHASSITTDRLHVGIGASLLGKRTRIHDNSYGKNKAIWELSMKHRFKNSQFIE